MELRKAAENDLQALIDFYGEVSDAMIGTPFDCQWRRGAHPSDEMIERAVAEDALTLADDNCRIAAAIIVNHKADGATVPELPWRVACPPEKTAIIHVLAVGSAYRGTGIARTLLEHAIEEARAAGMQTARISVAMNNLPAMRLYESCGFVRIVESVQLWGGVLVDALSLELPL